MKQKQAVSAPHALPETASDASSTVHSGGRFTRTRLLQLVLGLLLLAHFVQIFSPMRLDLDATSYLTRTILIVDGERIGPMWLPPGYSYMLAGLEWMGLGNAWAFAGLNWAFLVLGIAASYYVLRHEMRHSQETALLVCCMTLLSFVFVKYVPMPLADTAYFGLSMVVLALLSRVRQMSQHLLWFLLLALAVGVVAILTRTIGITLVFGLIGLVWAAARQRGNQFPFISSNNRVRLVTVLISLFFVIGSAIFVLNSRYLTETFEVWSILGIWDTGLNTLEARLKNWGELFVNAPRSVTPDPLHFIYPGAAVVALVLVFCGIFRHRRHWGPVEAYFVAYFLALLIYPGPQTRYWLPVVPLIIGWGAIAVSQVIRSKRRLLRPAIATYLLCVSLLGAAGIAYSCRITLSGSSVGDVYGDGSLSVAYDAAFREIDAPPQELESSLHQRVLLLLRRYEPRLSQTADGWAP